MTQKWLWVAAFIGCILGAWQLLQAFFTDGYPEMAGRSALAAALAVIPYVLARAREGFYATARDPSEGSVVPQSSPSGSSGDWEVSFGEGAGSPNKEA